MFKLVIVGVDVLLLYSENVIDRVEVDDFFEEVERVVIDGGIGESSDRGVMGLRVDWDENDVN